MLTRELLTGLGFKTSSIVTEVDSVKEAKALPVGTIVGDAHGGTTFSDKVAYALEARSATGWCDVTDPITGSHWTILVINQPMSRESKTPPQIDIVDVPNAQSLTTDLSATSLGPFPLRTLPEATVTPIDVYLDEVFTRISRRGTQRLR